MDIEQSLRALIDRHSSATGEHPVAVAELRNIVDPGSARMYPASQGWTATCGICQPGGDGKSIRRR